MLAVNKTIFKTIFLWTFTVWQPLNGVPKVAFELWLKGLPLCKVTVEIFTDCRSMFSVLMLEMWKQLCTTVVFDLLSAFMMDLWLYKATCIKYRMSQVPELSILELCLLPEELYWHTCCEYRAWDRHCLSFPSLSCSGPSLPWAAGWVDIALIRSLMWQ